VFAAALVIYGIGKTMFGNWGTTLLGDKGVSVTAANDGLAVFWDAVTGGRLIIALVSARVRSTHIYGLAAFGAGALQRVISLSAVFRVAGVAVIAMSVLAVAVARHQPSSRPSVEAAPGS
jgi:hypothetical protein